MEGNKKRTKENKRIYIATGIGLIEAELVGKIHEVNGLHIAKIKKFDDIINISELKTGCTFRENRTLKETIAHIKSRPIKETEKALKSAISYLREDGIKYPVNNIKELTK